MNPPPCSVGGEVRKCLEGGVDLGISGEFVQETETVDGCVKTIVDLFLTLSSVHYVCSPCAWGAAIE